MTKPKRYLKNAEAEGVICADPLVRRQSVPSIRSPQVADEIGRMLDAEKRLQDSYNSLSYHLRMHRRCVDEKLEPAEGSILHQLWRKGHLSRQQLIAWHRWLSDMRRALGKTDKLTVSYEERADSGGSGSNDATAFHGPGTYWTAEAAKVEIVWEKLRSHEKGLIEQLFRDTLRHSGYKEVHAHDLRYLGGIMSGYNDDRQKIAAGVSAIQRLLATLAEIYQVPHFLS